MAVPWWFKLAAKALASRAGSYRLWADLGVGSHGAMDKPEYAWSTWSKHFDRTTPRAGFSCLELGPGDALTTAVLVKAYGGSGATVVDAGRFISDDVRPYRTLAELPRGKGLSPPDLSSASTVEEVLEVCGAAYLTEGLASLRSLPGGSVDLIVSRSCLEHVRADELEPTLAELRRLVAPGGVASHRVDLQDHLVHGLNNLRFSRRVWEGAAIARSGVYTNRVRYQAMLAMLARTGWSSDVWRSWRWDALPTPRRAMQPEFRDLPDEDLLVRSFDVICRPV